MSLSVHTSLWYTFFHIKRLTSKWQKHRSHNVHNIPNCIKETVHMNSIKRKSHWCYPLNKKTFSIPTQWPIYGKMNIQSICKLSQCCNIHWMPSLQHLALGTEFFLCFLHIPTHDPTLSSMYWNFRIVWFWSPFLFPSFDCNTFLSRNCTARLLNILWEKLSWYHTGVPLSHKRKTIIRICLCNQRLKRLAVSLNPILIGCC